MIHIVLNRAHPYTIGTFLTSARSGALAGRIRLLSYDVLFELPALPEASYIFCDHERLRSAQRERLALIWRRLEAAPGMGRLLNNPMTYKRRHALLRCLKDQGVNSYAVHRLFEGDGPRRFPVFLRGENDHAGPITPLLEDAAALDAAIDGLLDRKTALWREPTLIVEYAAAPDERGHFVKYSAFCVGGEIIPRHRLVGPKWSVKHPVVIDEVAVEAEYRFASEHPHAAQLQRVFALAGAEYGRVDYSVVGGRLEIYEINSNPMTISPLNPASREPLDDIFAPRLVEALARLDHDGAGGWVRLRPKGDSARAQRLIDRTDRDLLRASLARTLVTLAKSRRQGRLVSQAALAHTRRLLAIRRYAPKDAAAIWLRLGLWLVVDLWFARARDALRARWRRMRRPAEGAATSPDPVAAEASAAMPPESGR